TMVGKFNHPGVYVDGVGAGKLDYLDFVDSVDENMSADRLLINKVNTSIGITMTRKIYAYSQQNHDNYFVYDYVLENTGIVNSDGDVIEKTLEDLVFFLMYRYAPVRESGPNGFGWLPQSSSWGHTTINHSIYTHPITNVPFRASYSWLGKHSQSGYDNIGGADIGGGASVGDGHLGSAQIVGTVVLHADTSPTDKTDDIGQPSTTDVVDSDGPITFNNDQFNSAQMANEYRAMTAGRPAETHAELVGDGFADSYAASAGGYSQSNGFGPYTLAHGESIHIVIAEGVGGLNREMQYKIGDQWINEKTPYIFPEDYTPVNDNDKNEFKNAWVFTGIDSLVQAFDRATATYNDSLKVASPPLPPAEFQVNSLGNRIELKWTSESEDNPNFSGYRVYRSIHTPDTTFEMRENLKPADLTMEGKYYVFNDTSLSRGFDYYYYITAYDDGSTNDITTGLPLESSKFYTMTVEPARLKRLPGESLADIRVVPNPFNIRSRELQFGISGPDRIMFYDIPGICTIKIYTERGDLIETIEHDDGSGDASWNSITQYRQVVVSGVYIAVIRTPEGEQAIRKFVIIR
nr:fibronectin type III domain-containing protein [Melioribacteraceae bacterium]